MKHKRIQKLVTALGNPNKNCYRSAKYKFGNNPLTKDYNFPVTALVEIFDPSEVIVLCTEGADATYNNFIQELDDWGLKNGRNIQEKHICVPRREEDISSILQAINDSVDNGETIHLDITLGLRSISYLAFLASQMLRFKNAGVGRLTYINHEASNLEDTEKGITRIIDITDYLKLPRLLFAGRVLERQGDLEFFINEIRETYPEILSSDFKNKYVEDAQRMLQFNLTPWIIEQKKGQKCLREIKRAFEEKEKDLPLISNLSELVNKHLSDLIMENNVREMPSTRFLVILVEWYFKHNQPIRAVIFMYESIKYYSCKIRNKEYPEYYNQNKKNREIKFEEYKSKALEELDKKGELSLIENFSDICKEIPHLRNKIAHAAFSTITKHNKKNQLNAGKFNRKNVQKAIKTFKELSEKVEKYISQKDN